MMAAARRLATLATATATATATGGGAGGGGRLQLQDVLRRQVAHARAAVLQVSAPA
jgi:hypothetical protein